MKETVQLLLGKAMYKLFALWLKFVMMYKVHYAYYLAKEELGIKVDKIRFKKATDPKPEEDVIAYTKLYDNGRIEVWFWLDAIVDTWLVQYGTDIFCDIPTLTYRLARHEFRHVWQYQNAFSALFIDMQRPYFLRVMEADANKYGNGVGYASDADAFRDEVEYMILT